MSEPAVASSAWAPVQGDLAIDGVSPRFDASPSFVEELADTLRTASAEGLAVTPHGGGTQLELGNVPKQVDLVLQTSRLNRVIEYEPADLTLTVEAGMRLAELQAQLGEQGQFLALDPPAEPEATIGGLIATNASGPLRFAYGTARDIVLGTRVANADGTLTRAGGRVVKNVAGYDLNKLYIGSLGTLGVIVELSFKVAPIPPATATVIGHFASPQAASGAVADVVHSPLSPLAIELLGDGASSAAGLTDQAALIFRLGGYPQAVERQVRDLRQVVTQHGGQAVEAPETAWEDLARMRRQASRRPVVLKAAAPASESSRLVQLLQERLSVLQPVVWAHAGNGIAYAACEAPPDAAQLLRMRDDVRQLGSNASLVIQGCPLELKRALDVWGDPGPSLALMRALKAKLDPSGTLNPGRYVGGI